jgi:hypothetical protein
VAAGGTRMDEQRPWHRLFGLSWQDFFRGAPVRVELEKDLSHRQQLLDLVILRAEGGPCRAGPPTASTTSPGTTWSVSSRTRRPWTAGP